MKKRYSLADIRSHVERMTARLVETDVDNAEHWDEVGYRIQRSLRDHVCRDRDRDPVTGETRYELELLAELKAARAREHALRGRVDDCERRIVDARRALS